jgi:exosortase
VSTRALSLPRGIPAGTLPAAAPAVAAAVAFALLFASPFATLLRDWWSDPEAGHGLLLGPLAVYLAYRAGWNREARPQPLLGLAVLVVAVVLRHLAGLAAEMFTLRGSMILAAVGLVVFYGGVRSVVRWWLPFSLLALSVPLPAMVVGSIALPLQFRATEMGAALLEMRNVPVFMAGNVLHLPGQDLFVTEACSGLRSLASLLALGVLIGGLWLRYPISRLTLVLVTIPLAMVLNGVRVFLTGFLVYYVDPSLGEGFMHMTEGWIIFVVAFGILGAFAWTLDRGEQLWRARA